MELKDQLISDQPIRTLNCPERLFAQKGSLKQNISSPKISNCMEKTFLVASLQIIKAICKNTPFVSRQCL